MNQQLFDAVMAEDLDMADQAVAYGANVNYRFKDRETPLSIASRRGATDLAEFLIEHGAELNVRDRRGHTPLMHSIKNGNAEITEMLMNVEPPAKAEWDGSDLVRTLGLK